MLACIQHTFPSFSLQPEKLFFPVLQTKIFQSNLLVLKRKKKMLRLIMKQQIIAALAKTRPTLFFKHYRNLSSLWMVALVPEEAFCSVGEQLIGPKQCKLCRCIQIRMWTWVCPQEAVRNSALTSHPAYKWSWAAPSLFPGVGRARGSELNCIGYGGHPACGWLMCGTAPCFHLPMALAVVIQDNALPSW